MRILAIHAQTDERITFRTQSEAARFAEVSPPTMTHYINCGKICRKGYKYIEVETPESELSVTQLYYRKKREKMKAAKYAQNEITPQDREKFRIMSYQKNRANVCITPCPYHYSPKPTIGSTTCQICPSFRAIDRKTLDVACARTNFIFK